MGAQTRRERQHPPDFARSRSSLAARRSMPSGRSPKPSPFLWPTPAAGRAASPRSRPRPASKSSTASAPRPRRNSGATTGCTHAARRTPPASGQTTSFTWRRRNWSAASRTEPARTPQMDRKKFGRRSSCCAARADRPRGRPASWRIPPPSTVAEKMRARFAGLLASPPSRMPRAARRAPDTPAQAARNGRASNLKNPAVSARHAEPTKPSRRAAAQRAFRFGLRKGGCARRARREY